MVHADRIIMQEGKGRAVNGTILGINAEKITVDVKGEAQEIAANVVASTIFEKEPPQLATARNAIEGSRMSEALEALAKIDPKALTRPEMKADFEFFDAVAKASLVQSGIGDSAAATKALTDFIKNHRSSYHYFNVCELYGDLMVQQGKFDLAKKSYETLAKAPWPEYSVKATVSLGMAEVAEKKIDEARKNFESVINKEDDSEGTERLKNIARIGMALCLVGEKKFDEAVKELEGIARESANEDSLFQSTVYNALGSAFEQADKPREAILAYMHTDILFSAARSEHIKALQALSRLWKKVKRNDRGEDVDKRLKELYNI